LPHLGWNGTFINFGLIVRFPDLQPVNLKVWAGLPNNFSLASC